MTDPASPPGEPERLEAALRAAQAEAAAARNELAATRRQLDAILASSSWRIMAPYRALGRAISALARRARPRPGTRVWRLLRAVYRAMPLDGRGRVRVLAFLRRRGVLEGGEPVPPPVVAGSPAGPPVEPWPASNPLLSVVVAGGESEALDSLRRQTFRDFEVLIVGPADSEPALPTDPALPLSRRVAGGRPRQDDRNLGVRAARGKYACCLEAEDRLHPTYLEKAVFLLEAEGSDLVSTALAGDDGAVRLVERHPVLADLLVGPQVAGCAVFSRALWESAGGFQDAGSGDSAELRTWSLWVKMAALGARIANLVDEPLCRRHRLAPVEGEDALELDRRRIASLNADVITEQALGDSERRRGVAPRPHSPLVNLRPREPSSAGPGTVLLALPFLVIGGADRLLSGIARHLQRRGYRVIVVTTLQVDAAVLGDSTADFEAATAEIYHLPRFLAPDLWRDFVFYLFETKGIDLLWVVGSAVFYDLLPELRAAFPRLKTMDLLFNAEVHVPNNRKHRSRIDLNLVENTEVLEVLARSGEPAERLRLIESGVDLTAHRPGPKSAEVLRELGIPAEAFVVGYSGRLAEEKRPETFIELAARLRDDPRLWFVMTGKGPLAGAVEERARRLGLGSRLRILGLVPDPRRVMAIYDVLLLPSRLDGRPVAVMESLAMGVPVVASRVGALPELVLDGETGFLCDPDSVADFAGRIAWLAAHPEEHRAMRLAARRFAERRLDAARMMEEYERAIAGLLGRPPLSSS